ncbi:hypothetical protein DIE23_37025 [Burkholderia sp. Bp9143]|nr:hypothetical protein DIE23_37025 [Burkholderia sp. Bp9143]
MSLALVGYRPLPSEALGLHARDLYERRHAAASVPRVAVAGEGWQPEVNRCHENVEEWCAAHLEYQIVRGWLYFSLPCVAHLRTIIELQIDPIKRLVTLVIQASMHDAFRNT